MSYVSLVCIAALKDLPFYNLISNLSCCQILGQILLIVLYTLWLLVVIDWISMNYNLKEVSHIFIYKME